MGHNNNLLEFVIRFRGVVASNVWVIDFFQHFFVDDVERFFDPFDCNRYLAIVEALENEYFGTFNGSLSCFG